MKDHWHCRTTGLILEIPLRKATARRNLAVNLGRAIHQRVLMQYHRHVLLNIITLAW